MGETDVRHEASVLWGELVKERSGGRLQFDIYPASTLVGLQNNVPALNEGLVDITAFWHGNQPELSMTKEIGIMAQPFDWEKNLEYSKEFLEKICKPEWAEVGVRPLQPWNDSSYGSQWFFREPGYTAEELFEGKFIRSIGPGSDQLIRALGGEPIQIDTAEFYTAAQRGTVDGAFMGTATFHGWGFFEVMPFMVIANVWRTGSAYAISLNTWDNLTPDLQKILEDTGFETAEWLWPRYKENCHKYVGEAAFKNGLATYYLPEKERQKWIAATEPYLEQMREKGGDRFAEMEAIVERYQ